MLSVIIALEVPLAINLQKRAKAELETQALVQAQSLAAAIGKEYAPELTIGNDPGTAAAIDKTGSRHRDCPVSEYIIDSKNKIVSTPAYMLAERISEAAEGIEKAVKATIELI